MAYTLDSTVVSANSINPSNDERRERSALWTGNTIVTGEFKWHLQRFVRGVRGTCLVPSTEPEGGSSGAAKSHVGPKFPAARVVPTMTGVSSVTIDPDRLGRDVRRRARAAPGILGWRAVGARWL